MKAVRRHGARAGPGRVRRVAVANPVMAARAVGYKLLAVAAAAGMLLGGGPATIPAPRLVVLVISSAILVWAVASRGSRYPNRVTREDGLVTALVALHLAYLVPLPGELWRYLPGRQLAYAIDLEVYGATRWRPLSLDREATLHSLVNLLPFIAAFAATRFAGTTARAAIITGLGLAFAITTIGAGMQLSLPQAEILQPYARGDYEFAVGVFTNHNHQASFILASMPLIAPALAGTPIARREGAGGLSNGLMLAVFGLAGSLACIASGSRAGLALLPLSVMATAWVLWPAREQAFDDMRRSGASRFGRAPREGMPWLTGALLSLFLLLGLAISGSGRFFSAPFLRPALGSDERWLFWPEVLHVARVFWPVGSGPGTFAEAYRSLEPLALVAPRYLNHAHNEYLQILVEMGALGLVPVGIAVMSVVSTLTREARARCPNSGARAGAAAVSIVGLHSCVEYPARTFAIAMVLGIGWGLMATRAEIEPLPGKSVKPEVT